MATTHSINGLGGGAAAVGEPHPRHRQHYPLPTTPGELVDHYYGQDIKETQQHVNPAFDQQSYPPLYHPNGPNHHHLVNRNPRPSLVSSAHSTAGPSPLSSYHHQHHRPATSTDTTLSNFLSSLFDQAKTSLSHSHANANSALSPSSSASSPSPSIFAPSSLKSNLGFILLCSLWYLSSAFSSNTGKSIMTQFRYPVTLTFVQFAFVAGYCVVFLAVREQFGARLKAMASAGGGGHGHGKEKLGGGGSGRRGSFTSSSSMTTTKGWGIRKPTKAMFQGTVMMSLFQIAGHVFSSMAIARVPVSTVHTIKALSPLFTVVSYAALFGVRYGPRTYLALLPLTLGVMLACSFDLRANAIGFLCALGSTVIFVSQNIFSKKLLPKESSSSSGGGGAGHGESGLGGGAGGAAGASGGGGHKLDKLNLLFYSSGMAFFLMIPIWLYSDAPLLFSSTRTTPLLKPTTDSSGSGTLTSLITSFFLNGTVHFAQNLLAFSILARTSPVTYSIASLVKRIAVICLAIIWSGQKVSLVQAMGMTMTFVGLWMYNQAKGEVEKGERKRGQVEKRQEMFLPTSLEDVRMLEGTPPPQPPPPTTTTTTTTQQHQQLQQQPRNRSLGAGVGGIPPPPPPPPPSTQHIPHHQPHPPPPPPPHASHAITIGGGGGGAGGGHR